MYLSFYNLEEIDYNIKNSKTEPGKNNPHTKHEEEGGMQEGQNEVSITRYIGC